MSWPVKPAHPNIKDFGDTSEGAKKYAKAMEDYENFMTSYETQKKIYQQETVEGERRFISDLEDEYCTKQYPKAVREKLYSMAYESGHHSGYAEVANYYSEYTELIDTFFNSLPLDLQNKVTQLSK